MKEITVYLQYPWRFPDSPYYKYLIENPPRGVKFLNAAKQKGVITNKRKFWISNFLKRNIRRGLNKLNLAIPNAHLSPKGDYDLIHCAHCLSKNEDKPWVADIEMLGSLAISGINNEKCQNKIEKIILKKNCKKIMPWTKHAETEILKIFPKIKNKVERVYPAVPLMKKIENMKIKGKLKIIFVARYFDIKGGVLALETLEILRKKYDIRGVVVSIVPKYLKIKYPKLEIYDLMSQKKLFNLMSSADIFLYPSKVDTFGFSLLEAMSFGIPTITLNTNKTVSRKEIIENNFNGYIFNVGKNSSENEIIEKLVTNTSKLIENRSLLKKMSKNCLNEIKSGKFSIKERNKKLKRIYGEALK